MESNKSCRQVLTVLLMLAVIFGIMPALGSAGQVSAKSKSKKVKVTAPKKVTVKVNS